MSCVLADWNDNGYVYTIDKVLCVSPQHIWKCCWAWNSERDDDNDWLQIKHLYAQAYLATKAKDTPTNGTTRDGWSYIDMMAEDPKREKILGFNTFDEHVHTQFMDWSTTTVDLVNSAVLYYMQFDFLRWHEDHALVEKMIKRGRRIPQDNAQQEHIDVVNRCSQTIVESVCWSSVPHSTFDNITRVQSETSCTDGQDYTTLYTGQQIDLYTQPKPHRKKPTGISPQGMVMATPTTHPKQKKSKSKRKQTEDTPEPSTSVGSSASSAQTEIATKSVQPHLTPKQLQAKKRAERAAARQAIKNQQSTISTDNTNNDESDDESDDGSEYDVPKDTANKKGKNSQKGQQGKKGQKGKNSQKGKNGQKGKKRQKGKNGDNGANGDNGDNGGNGGNGVNTNTWEDVLWPKSHNFDDMDKCWWNLAVEMGVKLLPNDMFKQSCGPKRIAELVTDKIQVAKHTTTLTKLDITVWGEPRGQQTINKRYTNKQKQKCASAPRDMAIVDTHFTEQDPLAVLHFKLWAIIIEVTAPRLRTDRLDEAVDNLCALFATFASLFEQLRKLETENAAKVQCWLRLRPKLASVMYDLKLMKAAGKMLCEAWFSREWAETMVTCFMKEEEADNVRWLRQHRAIAQDADEESWYITKVDKAVSSLWLSGFGHWEPSVEKMDIPFLFGVQTKSVPVRFIYDEYFQPTDYVFGEPPKKKRKMLSQDTFARMDKTEQMHNLGTLFVDLAESQSVSGIVFDECVNSVLDDLKPYVQSYWGTTKAPPMDTKNKYSDWDAILKSHNDNGEFDD